MSTQDPAFESRRPMLVSVVVIGRNEGARLARCLDSVAAMQNDGFRTELIYVDSGSSDGSVALAKAKGVHTIALTAERPSAAMGRNAGWRASKGAIVLFLDGDTILHPRFVQDSLPDFDAAEIAVVWGHRREIATRDSLYNRVLDLDWIFAPGLTPICGGDALFRRSVLEQTGGFDETLIAGEEPDLCRRIRALGYQVLHVDRPMTGHDLNITRWTQYWRRAVRAGHAFAEVADRTRESETPLWQSAPGENARRVLALAALAFCGLVLCMVLQKPWPVLIVLLCFLLLAARSAWKVRWKTTDLFALALYGVHSHVQQLPIFVGQLRYRFNRRRGRRAGLIEYKTP